MDIDADLCLHIINASFASVSGRVFAIRRVVAEQGLSGQNNRLRLLVADMKSSKDRITGIVSRKSMHGHDETLRIQSFLHTLTVFEVEFLARLQEWEDLLKMIGEVVRSDSSAVVTFEAIADILWAEKDCPVEILFTVLEAILHSSLDHSSLSVEKFSRWLRAICTILLSRNTASDRAKAIGYVEQAVTVMEAHGEGKDNASEFYPLDERQWLLGMSYNTGIECLHASVLDEAKRWFESSTVICRFIPDGQNRADKIHETYMHLLARYTHHT